MSWPRTCTAWFLLVAFVAGGVLGPTVHRVQHATERAATAAADRSCHSEAVHNAPAPVWTTEAEVDAPLDCNLCATRLLLSAPTSTRAPSPLERPTHATAFPSSLAPAPVAAHISIRGPPSWS